MNQNEEMTDEQALRPYKLREHQLIEILELFKRYRKEGMGIKAACAKIAPDFNRSPDAIFYNIQRFRPTGTAAASYLQANALRLAMRVVRKANVDQAIDVLSRPNIGVLEPTKKADGGSGGGFFISVNADTCGAVKVGIAGGQHGIQEFKGLPEVTETIDADVGHDVWEEGDADGRRTVGDVVREEDAAVQRADEQAQRRLQVTGRGTGHSKAFKDAVEAAQLRVQAARQRSEDRKVEKIARNMKKTLTNP